MVAALRRLGIDLRRARRRHGRWSRSSLGLVFGSSVGRALSLGWYIVGSFLLIGGFFVGNRGPARPQGEGWSAVFAQPLGALGRRRTSSTSRSRSRRSSSCSGFVLIALGALADPRYSLI